MISFEQFLELIDKNYYENEFEVRHGQTIMSTLHRVWPEKYKEISHTDYDCFYDDGKAELTIQKLRIDWIKIEG
jgi:hypothetical protein